MHTAAAHAAGVPLIKRFTGGGTVVVDNNTIFTSLIMTGPTALPQVPCYPRPIMQWTEQLFAGAIAAAAAAAPQPGTARARLRENGQ